MCYYQVKICHVVLIEITFGDSKLSNKWAKITESGARIHAI